MMWSANGYQSFADLMLNYLQFGCSNLPTKWQRVDIPWSASLCSVRYPDILVYCIQVAAWLLGAV